MLKSQSRVQDDLHSKALGLLTRRAHSRFELFTKLYRKGFASIAVQNECDRLEQSGLLNDMQFALDYVRIRAIKGFGPARIAYELRAKKIDEQHIEHALAQSEIDWQHCKAKVLAKKQASLQKDTCSDRKKKYKQQQFLCYRGFVSDD